MTTPQPQLELLGFKAWKILKSAVIFTIVTVIEKRDLSQQKLKIELLVPQYEGAFKEV